MTDLPRKILLATDGSPESDPELRAAADLSARTGAPVRVVHVGEDMPPARHSYDPSWGDLETGRTAYGPARVQAEMIERRGGTVAEVYAAPGSRPSHEIVKRTREEDVGLVVIGDRGLGRLRYASRSSVAANVVRDAYCPVLVVRGGLPGLAPEGFDQGRFPRKVLLATDGSPDAALAARKAVEITGGSGAEFHVAHVSEESGDHAGQGGREVLDAEVERIGDAGGAVAASHLLGGHPAGEIQKLAEEIGAELLVIGGRVSGPEVGPRAAASTSRSIVEGSSLPVLVVRGDNPVRPLVADPATTNSQKVRKPEGEAHR